MPGVDDDALDFSPSLKNFRDFMLHEFDEAKDLPALTRPKPVKAKQPELVPMTYEARRRRLTSG